MRPVFVPEEAMAQAVRDIVACPFCGADVIRGSDTCDACGRELQGTDIPESALAISDSHFAVNLGSIRLSKARTVTPGTSVADVIAILREDASGAVVVVDAGSVVGIFTERDVLKKIATQPERLADPVSRYMTPDPVVLRQEDPVAVALNKMGVGQFRHIPVLFDGRVEGMVVARDVVAWLLTRYFE
jgi:CBS domain-containing protein